MKTPVLLTFDGLERSVVIAEEVQRHADRLSQFFGRIISCRVAIACPHKRHRRGRLYSVRVDVSVPGADIVVTTNPGCLLQLEAGAREAGLPVRVLHLAQLLDEAYRSE